VPYVQVKVIEGVFGPEEKKEMVRAVTDAMVGVEGEAMRGSVAAAECPSIHHSISRPS
jgi:phenylpyruvate tautomerase PptA (4-oxalocrotonate tautomerase family)